LAAPEDVLAGAVDEEVPVGAFLAGVAFLVGAVDLAGPDFLAGAVVEEVPVGAFLAGVAFLVGAVDLAGPDFLAGAVDEDVPAGAFFAGADDVPARDVPEPPERADDEPAPGAVDRGVPAERGVGVGAVGAVELVPGGDERNARSTACTAPATTTSKPNRRNHLRRLTATRVTLSDTAGRDSTTGTRVRRRSPRARTSHPGHGGGRRATDGVVAPRLDSGALRGAAGTDACRCEAGHGGRGAGNRV